MEENSGKIKAFNRNDEQFLEAFVIFCGLGIQNTQMYEAVERAMAKQMVTLEVSSKTRWCLIGTKQILVFPEPCWSTHKCSYSHEQKLFSFMRILHEHLAWRVAQEFFCLFPCLPADYFIWYCILTWLMRFSSELNTSFPLHKATHWQHSLFCCVGRGNGLGD